MADVEQSPHLAGPSVEARRSWKQERYVVVTVCHSPLLLKWQVSWEIKWKNKLHQGTITLQS